MNARNLAEIEAALLRNERHGLFYIPAPVRKAALAAHIGEVLDILERGKVPTVPMVCDLDA